MSPDTQRPIVICHLQKIPFHSTGFMRKQRNEMVVSGNMLGASAIKLPFFNGMFLEIPHHLSSQSVC